MVHHAHRISICNYENYVKRNFAYMRKKVINAAFAKNIKSLRGSKTPEEIASIFKLDKATWYRYEKGMVPSVDILFQLAEYFRVDAKELVYGVKNVSMRNQPDITPNCPLSPDRCNSVPDDDKKFIEMLVTILTSKDEETKTGIRPNLLLFHRDVLRYAKDQEELDRSDHDALRLFHNNSSYKDVETTMKDDLSSLKSKGK